MILNDREIKALSMPNNPTYRQMITPFFDVTQRENSQGEGVISYGLTSFGYDMVLGYEFKAPEVQKIDEPQRIIDPKVAAAAKWRNFMTTDPFALYPGSFVLGRSLETWHIPADIIGIVMGKSTYARCGVIINVTPMEPEWEGVLTIEIHNAGQLPVMLYPGEGIAQVNFHRGNQPEVTYASKGGKYQHQATVQEAKL